MRCEGFINWDKPSPQNNNYIAIKSLQNLGLINSSSLFSLWQSGLISTINEPLYSRLILTEGTKVEKLASSQIAYMAALKLLQGCFVMNSKMVWTYLTKLKELGKYNKVSLLWFPRNSGEIENESAEELASLESASPFIASESFCKLSMRNFKYELQNEEAHNLMVGNSFRNRPKFALILLQQKSA